MTNYVKFLIFSLSFSFSVMTYADALSDFSAAVVANPSNVVQLTTAAIIASPADAAAITTIAVTQVPSMAASITAAAVSVAPASAAGAIVSAAITAAPAAAAAITSAAITAMPALAAVINAASTAASAAAAAPAPSGTATSNSNTSTTTDSAGPTTSESQVNSLAVTQNVIIDVLNTAIAACPAGAGNAACVQNAVASATNLAGSSGLTASQLQTVTTAIQTSASPH